MRSKWLGMGTKTRELEDNICDYLGSNDSIVMNNGTSSLISALIANNIGAGDKVLVPAYTFIATVNSILAVGAKPIFVDCDPSTFNITPTTVEEALENAKDVSCLLFVDVAGMPADIDGLRDFAIKNGLKLIEDAAEAFGSKYKNRFVGNYDHTAIFSFHIAKQMTMIEGGAAVTNDKEVGAKLRLIRNHGEGEHKYVHTEFGLNFRPTDLQSAIGLAQLKKVDSYLNSRRLVAEFYRKELSEFFDFQYTPDYVTRHTWMIFLCLAKAKSVRDHLNMHLNNMGIDTRIPWPPANIQPYHSKKLGKIKCLNAENVYDRILSLPIGNAFTEGQAARVTQVIKDFFKNYN